jgi:heme/copper-type cytochrome/quinol oxidase subunit 4
MDIPDVQPHEPAARYADSITKYIVIYVCILALAGVQFVIAYTHLSGTAMFARMLFVALAEAGLALMFFMHLWGEKRGFVLFVLILTGFVIWPCSMAGPTVIAWNSEFPIRRANRALFSENT